MRVLLVSPVFPPEPSVSGQISAQVAEALVQRGHEVIVIAAYPSRPSGKLYVGYRRTLFHRERRPQGYELVRCFSLLSRESRMVSRFGENLSFGFTSGLALLMRKRPDVIYANTWPIFAAGILSVVAAVRRVPVVITVQDVYPESLIFQNRIRADGWLARLLRRWDGRIARASRVVIAISERFAKIYRDDRGVPAGRVFMVPNWGDERLIVPDAGGLELRAELRIPADAFLLVYGGNIGIAAGVEGVIEAWGRLPVASRPYLLIAGEGASLVACQALAMQIAPLQVRFYTPWPAEKTSAVYAAADVLVLPTRGAQSLASVPSKLISYMLAARPVLAQALPDSDLAHTIREAGCGWVVEPDRPEILADTIRQIMALPRDELRRLGQAGRDYALRHLTRSACLPKVIEVLESVGKKKGVS